MNRMDVSLLPHLLDGVDLRQLAAQVPTPFYAYSANAIGQHVAELQQAMQGVDCRICYAVKANPTAAVLQLMAQQGVGADIVSVGEMHRSLRAGIPAGRIVFSGVGKTADEIDAALDAGVWRFNVESADELVKIIREVRPQVLVTYDQFGGYGHPDHIQAHRVAMYAAQLAAVPSYRLDLGEPHDIAKIYWTAMSESRMRESLRLLRESGDTETFKGMEPDGKLPPFVTPDDLISARIDGSATVQRKMEALRKHATQVEQDGHFFAGGESGHAMWSDEFYRLAKGTPGKTGADGFEEDLFAGL